MISPVIRDDGNSTHNGDPHAYEDAVIIKKGDE